MTAAVPWVVALRESGHFVLDYLASGAVATAISVRPSEAHPAAAGASRTTYLEDVVSSGRFAAPSAEPIEFARANKG
jgi:hypothetical protein